MIAFRVAALVFYQVSSGGEKSTFRPRKQSKKVISGSTQKIEFKKEMLVEKTVLVRGKDMVGDGEEDALKEIVGCVGCEEAVSVGGTCCVCWMGQCVGWEEGRHPLSPPKRCSFQ